MLNITLISLFLLLLAFGLRKDRRELPMLLAVVGDGDEDMKIAGDSFSRPPAEDPAEAEARHFLKEKDSGNIEKARALGKSYAASLQEAVKEYPRRSALPPTQLEYHHQLLLCSYIVNRVIAEFSPNSILAQTSLQVFYQEIEQNAPELYKHISDPAAFSLYILCDRSSKRNDSEIGNIYAQLCNREGDPETIGEGNHLFRWFYDACAETMKYAAYSEV